MIHQNTKEKIKEPYATEIREALKRARTGNLNENDLKAIIRSKEILKRYTAVWKD